MELVGIEAALSSTPTIWCWVAASENVSDSEHKRFPSLALFLRRCALGDYSSPIPPRQGHCPCTLRIRYLIYNSINKRGVKGESFPLVGFGVKPQIYMRE